MLEDNTISTSFVTARIRALSHGMQMRVLTVDDDEIEQALLADRLAACGLEVIQAQNGEEALKLLQEQWFPIIVTDWQMPSMDGIELTQRIRGLGVNDSYVIMLTVLDSEFDYERGYLAGVDDYLTKKMPTTEILARIHTAFTILTLRRSLREANRALAAAGIGNPPPGD